MVHVRAWHAAVIMAGFAAGIFIAEATGDQLWTLAASRSIFSACSVGTVLLVEWLIQRYGKTS